MARRRQVRTLFLVLGVGLVLLVLGYAWLAVGPTGYEAVRRENVDAIEHVDAEMRALRGGSEPEIGSLADEDASPDALASPKDLERLFDELPSLMGGQYRTLLAGSLGGVRGRPNGRSIYVLAEDVQHDPKTGEVTLAPDAERAVCLAAKDSLGESLLRRSELIVALGGAENTLDIQSEDTAVVPLADLQITPHLHEILDEAEAFLLAEEWDVPRFEDAFWRSPYLLGRLRSQVLLAVVRAGVRGDGERFDALFKGFLDFLRLLDMTETPVPIGPERANHRRFLQSTAFLFAQSDWCPDAALASMAEAIDDMARHGDGNRDALQAHLFRFRDEMVREVKEERVRVSGGDAWWQKASAARVRLTAEVFRPLQIRQVNEFAAGFRDRRDLSFIARRARGAALAGAIDYLDVPLPPIEHRFRGFMDGYREIIRPHELRFAQFILSNEIYRRAIDRYPDRTNDLFPFGFGGATADTPSQQSKKGQVSDGYFWHVLKFEDPGGTLPHAPHHGRGVKNHLHLAELQFAREHEGQAPTRPDDLLPYIAQAVNARNLPSCCLALFLYFEERPVFCRIRKRSQRRSLRYLEYSPKTQTASKEMKVQVVPIDFLVPVYPLFSEELLDLLRQPSPEPQETAGDTLAVPKTE